MHDSNIAQRQNAMRLLAGASAEELAAALDAVGRPDRVRTLRGPEIGLVMVRGRVGGDGKPFNLGEATVTRCAVELPSGTQGHAYILGRHPERARDAALLDALAQEPATRAAVEAAVLAPVAQRLAHAADERGRETAATRVDFFTLVRGED